MGISTGGSKGRQRSEINVTPLVDVVLVLLIIFLVTMPIMMKQVSLDVPRKIDTAREEATNTKQLTILLKADGKVIVNNGLKDLDPILQKDLAQTMRPMLDSITTEKLVFVDFCDSVPWSQVVSAMDDIRSIAKDKDHDEVKVALKMRDKGPDGQPAVWKTPNDPGIPDATFVGCPIPQASVAQ